MKMTNAEPSLRMPKEATCDVECAMKVEEIRILNKKRKQSQRTGGSNGAVMSKVAVNGKAAKRALTAHAGSGGAAPSLSKSASAGGGGSKDSRDSSRRRFVWSVPLHQDFVAAVFDVGLKCASPKLLLEMMPVVDGLTSEHIKSHLQKYRLHRQRSREEFLKSYNYLTDLDGGKGLGGGSAAATVAKAAAAAAGGGGSGGGGDSKRSFSGCGLDPEPTGCWLSCDCNDTFGRSGGDGGGKALAKPAGASPDAGKGEGSERNSGDGGGDAKAGVLQAGGGMEAAVASLGETASGGAVNGALVLSHLELLAKGIDMQVQFHNHLRDVVQSQQLLHAQLAGRQGSGHVPQRPAEGRTASPSSSGMASPPAVSFSSPAGQQDVGGGARVKELKQVQREVRLVVGGGGGSLAGYRPLSGSQQQQQQATAAASVGWRIAGAHKANGSSSAADPRSSGSAAETPTRKGAPAPAADVSAEAGSRPERDAADHHSSLRADKTGEVGGTQRQHHQPQQRDQHQHQHQQFNPTAMREALSVQTGVGGVFVPQGLLSMERPASRGYVPGEYTLTSKTSETGASNSSPQMAHAQMALLGLGDGQLRSHGSSALAARSPAEARAALAAAGLAPPMPTGGSSGQEALMLQKHMQAQMSMQQSMLSACDDQATNFGRLAWCGDGGGGVAPALGGGEAAGSSANRGGASGGGRVEVRKDGSGGGGGGGGGGDGGGGEGDGGTGAGVGIKEQRLDSLSLHPGDGGDSSSMMGMGLLQQDDMFDFSSMLDRETELKSGESPADPPPSVRPGGDEQSLFSFLME